MKKSESIFWMGLVSLLIAFIIGLFSLNNYINIIIEIDQRIDDKDYAVYSIQHEDNPLNKNIEDFNRLYKLLVDNQKEGYTYYEIYRQYLENVKEQSSFYSQETGRLEEACQYIQCMQVSLNTLLDFDVILSQGEMFEDSDYKYETDKEIPVLMGNSYSDHYSIGDTFTFTYLFDEYTFIVIGFIEQGNSVCIGNIHLLLDQYIVMPSYEIAEAVKPTNGLKIHYANKTSGIVKLPIEKYELFYSEVEPLLNTADVGAYSWNVHPREVAFQDVFGLSISTVKKLMLLIVVIFILGICVSIYKLSKINWNNRRCVLYGFFLFIGSSIFNSIIEILYRLTLGMVLRGYQKYIIIATVSIVIPILCRKLKK